MLGRLGIGENVPELLKADLDLENEAIPCCARGISLRKHARRYQTRCQILDNEEEHVDTL